MDKYRIVEHHHKYYVEVLKKILFWRYYVPITNYAYKTENIYEQVNVSFTQKHLMGNLEIKYYDTLEDAKNYVDGCIKKYHKV